MYSSAAERLNINFSYHPCDLCSTESKKVRNDEEKHQKLRKIGHLQIMRECEWNKMIPSLRKLDTPSFPKILHNVGTEEDIINGIVSGEFFGFIKCDISSPSDFIEENLKINFPPLIKRLKVDEELLSPYMRDICKTRGTKFPVDTVVQSYHAENHLLFTPLAKFYLKNGLKITNIEYFIQYRKDRALSGFVSKITEMRMEADREDKPTKGTTAKLCGNRFVIIIYIIIHDFHKLSEKKMQF